MPAIVNGLARRTPWAGVDRESLDEFYLSAAATVSRIAASGERRDWRTARHLERAAIAAFRHEALAHWKSVNAQKRRGDREATPFDPYRDGDGDDPLNRIYESDPREELVARDWLAQLRGQVREFWAPVILDGTEFKQAGERLGLDKAERQAMYREGVEHLGRFRALLEEGRVCQLRAPAIAAYRAGTADAVTAERARAHLACCLPCALVHDPSASALKRGILHALPLGAIGRAVAWVRELPVGRTAEAASGAGGALVVGKGVAVAVCTGAVAASVCATIGVLPSPLTHQAPHRQRHAPSASGRASKPIARASSASATPMTTTTTSGLQVAPTTPSPTPPRSTGSTASPSSGSQSSGAQVSTLATMLDEFDVEGAAGQAQRAPSAAKPRASVARVRARRPRPRARSAVQASSEASREFDPEAQSTSGTPSTGSASAAAPAASAPTATAASTSSSTSSGSSSAASGGGSEGSASSATQEFGQP